MSNEDAWEAGRCARWWFETCARDDASAIGLVIFMIAGAYLLFRFIGSDRRDTN